MPLLSEISRRKTLAVEPEFPVCFSPSWSGALDGEGVTEYGRTSGDVCWGRSVRTYPNTPDIDPNGVSRAFWNA